MKVLLVNGSSHEKGCTYTALAEVAKALNANGVETEIYWIGQKETSGCKGCWACKKTKNGLLYAPYIHTKKDVVVNNDNILFIADGVKTWISSQI